MTTSLFSTRGADPTTAPAFLAPLEGRDAALDGSALPVVADLRARGRARFAAVGLPTVKNEAWRYTNLRELAKQTIGPVGDSAATPVDRLPTVRRDGAGPRLVFVDGRFRADLSTIQGLPTGVLLTDFASACRDHADLVAAHLGRLASADDRPLVALNSADLTDGVVLRVGAGVAVADPIELVYVTVGREGVTASSHPRALIVLETGARAVLVEHHISQGGAAVLSNHVAEITIGEGATLHHCKVQRENDATFHLSHIAASVATNGVYDNFILTLGARLSRNEVVSALDGRDARTHVSGGYMVRGHQHADISTIIDHAQPNGTSREVYKGVIDDHGRAAFQGKIIVRPHAQKTDGHQLNRALLLSDSAEIDAKPELQIFADDVKCSHGCTVGELDDDALFYLRARGIDKETARGLLIGAFLADVLDEIAETTVRDAFQGCIAGWLEEQR